MLIKALIRREDSYEVPSEARPGRVWGVPIPGKKAPTKAPGKRFIRGAHERRLKELRREDSYEGPSEASPGH
jgi:hypothetical protein